MSSAAILSAKMEKIFFSMSLIRIGETDETFFFPGYSARERRTADSQAGDSSKTTYLSTCFQFCSRV